MKKILKDLIMAMHTYAMSMVNIVKDAKIN